jgi:hypothetical protein
MPNNGTFSPDMLHLKRFKAILEVYGLFLMLNILKVSSLLEAVKMSYLAWQFFVFPTISGPHSELNIS